MKRHNSFIIIIITIYTLLFFSSCLDSEMHYKKVKVSNGIYVLNEGNFTSGNASVSLIVPDSSKVINNIFKKNNGRPLGDVAQSMIKIGNRYFIVINNSGKIEIVNNNFESIETVTHLKSPRYIIPINDSILYISDLYANGITLLNYKTYKKVGFIKTGKPTERMVLYNNKIFVTNWSYGNNTIQVINTKNSQIIKEIIIGLDPTDIFLDKNNKIWVISSGGSKGNKQTTDGKIQRINPITFDIEKTYIFNEIHPSRMAINRILDTIYYMASTANLTNISNKFGIYKMAINSENAPDNPSIKQREGNLFYNFGIDHSTNDIYIADAIDYQQNGIIFRFHNNTKLDSFRVGIIPQFIFFENNIYNSK